MILSFYRNRNRIPKNHRIRNRNRIRNFIYRFLHVSLLLLCFIEKKITLKAYPFKNDTFKPIFKLVDKIFSNRFLILTQFYASKVDQIRQSFYLGFGQIFEGFGRNRIFTESSGFGRNQKQKLNIRSYTN